MTFNHPHSQAENIDAVPLYDPRMPMRAFALLVFHGDSAKFVEGRCTPFESLAQRPSRHDVNPDDTTGGRTPRRHDAKRRKSDLQTPPRAQSRATKNSASPSTPLRDSPSVAPPSAPTTAVTPSPQRSPLRDVSNAAPQSTPDATLQTPQHASAAADKPGTPLWSKSSPFSTPLAAPPPVRAAARKASTKIRFMQENAAHLWTEGGSDESTTDEPPKKRSPASAPAALAHALPRTKALQCDVDPKTPSPARRQESAVIATPILSSSNRRALSAPEAAPSRELRQSSLRPLQADQSAQPTKYHFHPLFEMRVSDATIEGDDIILNICMGREFNRRPRSAYESVSGRIGSWAEVGDRQLELSAVVCDVDGRMVWMATPEQEVLHLHRTHEPLVARLLSTDPACVAALQKLAKKHGGPRAANAEPLQLVTQHVFTAPFLGRGQGNGKDVLAMALRLVPRPSGVVTQGRPRLVAMVGSLMKALETRYGTPPMLTAAAAETAPPMETAATMSTPLMSPCFWSKDAATGTAAAATTTEKEEDDVTEMEKADATIPSALLTPEVSAAASAAAEAAMAAALNSSADWIELTPSQQQMLMMVATPPSQRLRLSRLPSSAAAMDLELLMQDQPFWRDDGVMQTLSTLPMSRTTSLSTL